MPDGGWLIVRSDGSLAALGAAFVCAQAHGVHGNALVFGGLPTVQPCPTIGLQGLVVDGGDFSSI